MNLWLSDDCPLCGAVVKSTNVTRHEEWHDRQSRLLADLAEIAKNLTNLVAGAYDERPL